MVSITCGMMILAQTAYAKNKTNRSAYTRTPSGRGFFSKSLSIVIK